MVLPISKSGIFNWMDDRDYLKMVFKCVMGYSLDLSHPVTFSEKIQWLKLYDRKDIYTMLVDKILVKEYVSEKIGDKYIIPTIGIWNSFDEIDFNTLPKQFVLKCNHDQGSIVICKDRNSFNIESARKKLSSHLQRNPFFIGREWPYKNVEKRIFAEQLLFDNNSDLIDYKFFCFNGKARFCQVIQGRTSLKTIDFFDMNWIHQPFVGLTPNIKNSNTLISKPLNFELMKQYAEDLCNDTYFCRVDFYEVLGELYFGEITFYPASGFGYFTPFEWNTTLGNMIKLPTH